MKPKTTRLPRFKPLLGWVNRLLRVDLTEGRIWAEETESRLPDFLGARGLAAKVIWDEYPQPVGAFDPRNPFMVMPGALTGTIAPYSGRTNVCAFSPQSDPYNWFTRASIGSDWGDRLKKAGYDGVVVTGTSDTMVHVLIRDDEVSILPAEEYRGLDCLAVQQRIRADHGQQVRTLSIGPAGERLSRIATVQTASTSVAGQGGFGAVMGSKGLKALSVVGSGRVPVADPERLTWLFRAVGEEARTHPNRRRDLAARNDELAKEGGGKARLYACTASCPTPCKFAYSDVPGSAGESKLSGVLSCVSHCFSGGRSPTYDWNLGFAAGFQQNMLGNRLGLNHWDLLIGIIPWLRMAKARGELAEINGYPIDLDSPEFWSRMLHDMAYREGDGDALAEGGWRAAALLGVSQELVLRYYTGWGYAGHWDGHGDFVNRIVFPFWLGGMLQWAMDTRDPISSMHGYVQHVMHWGPLGRNVVSWDQMRNISQRVYGRSDALDPLSGYEGKEVAAAHHQIRAIMQDCLPTDDQVFPLFYSPNSPDRFCRVTDIDGPDVDAAILRAGTGLDWDTKEFMRAAERVVNLERAIVVRHWGRDRAMDERVLPAFEYEENWVNPEIGSRQSLTREPARKLMDDYYRLMGWDGDTGWPTAERLAELDLGSVHEPMVSGAMAARQSLPALSPAPRVTDWHASAEGDTTG